MMDLSPLVQAILVYSVLAVGVLVTVLTGFAQVRALGQRDKDRRNVAVRRGFLAASVGMGSVGGSILALELGGPGAIGWMWIASLLGMALVYAEVLLAIRHRRRLVSGEVRTGSVYVIERVLGSGGRTLAFVFTLLFLGFALSAGSLLQTQQSSALLSTVGGDRWMVVAFLVLAAGAGMLVPKLRAFVVALGPVAVGLYAVAVVWIIARAPGDPVAAFGQILAGMAGSSEQLVGGAAGGGVLMALQAGFLRATLATEAGLGSASFTQEAEGARAPESAAASAMLAPLIAGIFVPTLTALAAMTATPWVGQRIDEPGERRPALDERLASAAEMAELVPAFAPDKPEGLDEADQKRVVALWAPLEHPQSRGGAASLQAGQTVVLPEDAVVPDDAPESTPGLRRKYVYPMIMRGSPRGSKVPHRPNENQILLPYSEEAAVVSQVVFRDRDPARTDIVAYDRRFEVETERFSYNGRDALRIKPVDPSVNFDELAKLYDGPYVVLGDYHFLGRVERMFQTSFGVHDALIEAEQKPADGLSLRTTLPSPSWRGPYLDEGEPRPPLAMVTKAGFDAPIGARIPLAYESPERGLEIGRMLPNGQLMTPPWSFLGETKFAILRHNEDPSKDLRVPVDVELVDGTWRFTSANTKIVDFETHERWKDFVRRPFLEAPPYVFMAEVHSGVRFPPSTATLQRTGEQRHSITGPYDARRTLVAVHPHGEPQGSPGKPYDPHPAEVAPFMDGPRVVGEGIERLGFGSRLVIERGGDLLLAISILLLALTTMIAWAGYGARAADYALGRGAGLGFRVVFLLVGLGGAVLDLLPILRVADTLMIGLILIHGAALIAGLVQKASPEARPHS